MKGVELSRVYAHGSPFPLRTFTDHLPLTFVKATSGKGPVSQFVLDHLSDLDYTLEYKKGTANEHADALSRYPCIGPAELAPEGEQAAIRLLLENIPETFKPEGKPWVYSTHGTVYIRDRVAAWQKSITGSVQPLAKQDRPTPTKIERSDYCFGVWIMPADKAVQVCQAALAKDQPFACLLSNVLVPRIAGTRERHDESVQQKVDEASKIAILATELTWIVHGVGPPFQRVMAAWTINTFLKQRPGYRLSGILVQPPAFTQENWCKRQKDMLPKYKTEEVLTRTSDGLSFYTPDEGTMRMIVPTDYVEPLVKWQHRSLTHAGINKVVAALSRHFHWHGMHKDIKNIVSECNRCQVLKARRNRAHKHFRAVTHHEPRTAYGMDYYGVAKSAAGYNQILGVIDLATSEVRLFPTKGRSADTTARTLLHGLFLRNGIPLQLHSDAARELIGGATKTICDFLGCKQTSTLAHHPTGNAAIERLWQFVGKALRQMTDDQYKSYEKYVRLMEFTWNTMETRSTAATPFEAAHGLPARTVVNSVTAGNLVGTPREVTTAEVALLKEAAQAFALTIRDLRSREQQERANIANDRGRATTNIKVDDFVVFEIPPTQREAERKGRKAKHLDWYRGPARVISKLSNSTYELEFKGKTYHRAISELRPWRGQVMADQSIDHYDDAFDGPSKDSAWTPKKGDLLAYRINDSNACRLFHIGKVRELSERK